MNQNSITTAILASGIFNAFSGKDSKKISAEDLIPFPDLLKRENTKKVFSDRTREIVYKLLKERRIPPAVAAFLHQIPEIQQKYIADG